MIIKAGNNTFILSPNTGDYGASHAKMVEDFKDESKLNYFKKLLSDNADTAFAVYNGIDTTHVWDKESHCAEIEAAVDKMVSAKLIELNYTNFQGEPSVGDVSAGVTDEEALWHLEAVAVGKWYNVVYAAMYAYIDSVNEATALPVADFIASLPQLQTNDS
jgi:hypothetical protein